MSDQRSLFEGLDRELKNDPSGKLQSSLERRARTGGFASKIAQPNDVDTNSLPTIASRTGKSTSKIAQLPDLGNTLLTTIFNLLTGLIFAVHAIFMQWGILFLAGQLVMIEFNDLLREDFEKLLDGETPDMSSPGFIAIVLWVLETLVALTLTLTVHEEHNDKSWFTWTWKVGSWAVAPFFVVDGIALVSVILFFFGTMDIKNEWLAYTRRVLMHIGPFLAVKKVAMPVSVMFINSMPAVKSCYASATAKFVTFGTWLTTTAGGPWRDSLTAKAAPPSVKATPAPVTSIPATSIPAMSIPVTSSKPEHTELENDASSDFELVGEEMKKKE